MKHLKIFGFLILIVLLTLTGCKDKNTDKDKTTPTSLEEVETWVKNLYADNLVINNDDLGTLPTKYMDKNVTISWVSSHPNRIDATGYIVGRDTKKVLDVDLTYTITNEEGNTITGVLPFKLFPRSLDWIANKFESQFPTRLQEDMSEYLETNFDENFKITWSSSNEEVFTNEGVYIKPVADTPFVISYRVEVDENHFIEDSFEIVALGASDEEKLYIVSSWLQNEIIPDLNISDDINMPTTHPEQGTEIIWTTGNSRIVDLNGKVTRYVFDRYVDVRATIYSGSMMKIITFWFKVEALDISKMSEVEVLENFLSAIAEDK